MKFPRHAKILRSHFDVAPFAAVFFVVVIFLLLGALLPTPGIQLQPPSAADLPGVNTPTVAMAIDAQGQFYFENQIVTGPQLKRQLAVAARAAHEPLTLVIHADKTVTYDQLAQLALLVRDLDTNRPAVSITNLLLATLPRAEAVARP